MLNCFIKQEFLKKSGIVHFDKCISIWKNQKWKSYKEFSVRHEEEDLPKETLHTPKILFFMWPAVTGVSQKVISLHLKVK